MSERVEPGPPRAPDSVPELADRVRRLPGRRVLLGVAGEPGAGKSTLARQLADALTPDAVVVPFDGFHFSNRILDELGRSDRKGAIDTFDVAGYAATLRRIRAADGTVYAPMYVRDVEETIAASIAVPPEIPIVITEGNYLLSAGAEWEQVRSCLDEIWYVETDNALRLRRLVERHIQFGKDSGAAVAWAYGSDERNARLIRRTRDNADLIVVMG